MKILASRAAALVAMVLSTNAAAQSASDLKLLAECRLNPEEAYAVLEKLTAVSAQDVSDDEGVGVNKTYDPALIAPFGLQATRFSDHLYQGMDPDYQVVDYVEYYYYSDLSVSYDQAKRVVLASLGLPACLDEGQNYSKTSTCKITPRGDGVAQRTLVGRADGTSALRCDY